MVSAVTIAFVIALIVLLLLGVGVGVLSGRAVSNHREIDRLRAELVQANARMAERNSLATVGEIRPSSATRS